LKRVALQNYAGINGIENGCVRKFVTGIIYISTELLE
jgi:hypothetical protein